MGPIPGISWGDVADVATALFFVATLLWVTWAFADGSPTGRARTILDRLAIPSLLPFLFVATNRPWLAMPGWVVIAALIPWLIEFELVRRRARAYRRALRAARDAADLAEARAAGGPIPPPSELAALASAVEPVPERRPRTPRRRLMLLLLASMIVAPRAIAAAVTRTSCEQTEVALAGQQVHAPDTRPVAWMPSAVPGLQLVDSRWTTLESVAAGRKNPDASRRELGRDGFVGGFESAWEGRGNHVEFEAQQFATRDGAVAFQAFAMRYACMFANVAFLSSQGAVGLQIRFATGRPIGEQLSWVSGTTRLVVFAGFDAPPPNHGLVEQLAVLVGR